MNRSILIAVYAVILLLLLFCSFVFSSADMAYGSIDSYKLDEQSGSKRRKEKARKLVNDYDRTITTILFMNNTVNAGLDSLATLIGVNLAYICLVNDPNVAAISETWGLVCSLCVLIFKIAFGEIVPKSVTKLNRYKFALAYADVISVLIAVFTPLTMPIAFLAKKLSKGVKENVEDVEITDDDLHEMVDDIEEQGSVDEEKADFLHDTIDYTVTEAQEVMTPRVDVFALDIDDGLEGIKNNPEVFEHARVPVYRDTIDNVIGYIQTRTLMVKLLSEEEFSIDDILLEPLRFPQTAEINDIMRTFKKTKQHFALILDEYGGLDGILTMEDILEEIVGEIWDEKDSRKEPIVERKDGSYILDGAVTLEDFCDLFHVDFDSINTEYLTIGGFVIELFGDRFPKKDETVEFEDISIQVIAVEDNGAVSKLLCKKNEEEKTSD